eukprot:GHVU01099735.1.p2 GENE.GHVU01099735.1~~GHVU01099735.1.p2  ORF type:complete len:164 (+),score=22.57 GHVU01099735.1:398-889(+)
MSVSRGVSFAMVVAKADVAVRTTLHSSSEEIAVPDEARRVAALESPKWFMQVYTKAMGLIDDDATASSGDQTSNIISLSSPSALKSSYDEARPTLAELDRWRHIFKQRELVRSRLGEPFLTETVQELAASTPESNSKLRKDEYKALHTKFKEITQIIDALAYS